MTAHPWRYGLLGLPLAFLALPLYLSLPEHYAREFGVPLASLGALLLAARLGDAFIDPWIGRFADRLLQRGQHGPWMLLAAATMAAAFVALFFPPTGVPLLPWAAVMLVFAYLGYSLLGVSHQAWGAREGGDTVQQARLVAWREGFALAGVLLASVLISEAGWALTSGVLLAALGLGLWALLSLRVPRDPNHGASAPAAPAQPWDLAWRTPGFKPLIAVYAVNGIAAAVPATVLLFFVRDRLQAPEQQAGFLMAYFLAAAVSLPLWLRVVARLGAVRAWALGMGLAIAAFVWAYGLGSGDVVAFYAICLATGVAAGADLAIPPALLTGVVQRAGLAQQSEGAFFGWWAATTKLNLALAAGVALPLLQFLGYAPGVEQTEGLQALSTVYALLPCALKLVALALLLALLNRTPR